MQPPPNDQVPAGLAKTLEELHNIWTGPRALGGWWALSGFSFQAAVFLLRFFEQVRAGANPRDLPVTELISDILVPAVGNHELIQVKRRLTRGKMKAALREAYDIAALCDDVLLEKMRFRIACLEAPSGLSIVDFSLEEIAGGPGDPRIWRWLAQSFERPDAITVEADPLDQLHNLLWHAGILDIPAFIDGCLGIFLAQFAKIDPAAVKDVASALAGKFQAASGKRDPPRQLGDRLQPSDFDRNPDEDDDKTIVFNRPPLLTDLRRGRFRTRDKIFSDLRDAYRMWWHEVSTRDDVTSLPIFWIDGRSGEGKSVLLLQLMAAVMSEARPPVSTLLRNPGELPDWILRQAEIQQSHSSAAMRPALVFVDDLHLIDSREAWAGKLRRATQFDIPRVAIVACGPTLERQSFHSEFSNRAEITSFTVPNLSAEEMLSFRDWYSTRSGRVPAVQPTTVENRLLVIWIFELVQGEGIAEFAGNFRSRLEHLGLFELASAIVAVNALNLLAPLVLLDALQDHERDSFGALCARSQFHFETVHGDNPGLRLGHPQIGWSIFREWVRSPTTVAAAWGRALSRSVIAAVRAGNTFDAGGIIHQAGTTFLVPRAANGVGTSESAGREEGDLGESLRAILANLSREAPIEQWAELLPRWLDIATKYEGFALTPDPVELALDLAKRVPVPEYLPGFVAGWLWRLGDLPSYHHRREEFEAGADAVILAQPGDHSSEASISMIARRALHGPAALALCKRWLAKDEALDSSGRGIATIIARWPHDEYVQARAAEWVKRHRDGQTAYTVLGPLLARRPQDELVDLAIDWIQHHRTTNQPVGYYLLEPLIAARPADDRVQNLAWEWIGANQDHPQVRHLLAPMLRFGKRRLVLKVFAERWIEEYWARSDIYYVLSAFISAFRDQTALELGLRWARSRMEDLQLDHVLTALLGAFPKETKVRDLALDWLAANTGHLHIRRLWGSLIAAWRQDDGVVGAAVAWAGAHRKDPQIYELINALVAARPDDKGVVQVLLDWLEDNPDHRISYASLATLVNARPDDDEIMAAAVAWMKGHPTHHNAYWLLAAMVAARRADSGIFSLTLKWLDSNTTHEQAPFLFTALVAARFDDRRVTSRVRRWFKSQPPRPGSATLLGLLIRKSQGAREWVLLGEAYLEALTKGSRRAILVALLVGSKASRRYVDMVIEAISRENDVGARQHLTRELGGCLAYNIEPALRYLANAGTEDARQIAASAMANALRRHGERSERFLDRFNEVPPTLSGMLLAAAIASPAEAGKLNAVLGPWLGLNCGAAGFYQVMNALEAAPDRWKAVREQVTLPPEVIAEYRKTRP